jgi:hypothetical protein
VCFCLCNVMTAVPGLHAEVAGLLPGFKKTIHGNITVMFKFNQSIRQHQGQKSLYVLTYSDSTTNNNLLT